MDEFVFIEGNDKIKESKDYSSSDYRYLMGGVDCLLIRDIINSIYG